MAEPEYALHFISTDFLFDIIGTIIFDPESPMEDVLKRFRMIGREWRTW
jgi:hypothetical protein